MHKHYDLFVLDIMPPGMDGYELCRRLRARRTPRSIPLFFGSRHRARVGCRVGLEIGGDDYLAKPFGVRELIARVRALLRAAAPWTLSRNPPRSPRPVSRSTKTAIRQRAKTALIDLTPREFELLAALMKDAGKVVTREDLLREAWGWEYITETKTVDTHIKRLRDKLSAAGFDPPL